MHEQHVQSAAEAPAAELDRAAKAGTDASAESPVDVQTSGEPVAGEQPVSAPEISASQDSESADAVEVLYQAIGPAGACIGLTESVQAQSADAVNPEGPVPGGLTAANFVTQKKKNVNVLYNVEGTPIGRGGFGVVYSAIEKATKRKVAIKFLPLARCQDIQTLKEEIELTKELDHPHIVKIFASFQDRTHLAIVMELCPGGELFNRITAAKGKKIPENLALKVMSQMLRAINYMHGRGVVHRDLKPENFLLATKEPLETNTIKLIDFGLSKHVTQEEQLSAIVGSSSYVAPEVIAGSYNKAADLWSCGVMLYLMISGQLPFTGTSDRAVLQKIRRGDYRLSGRLWEPVSSEVKDLIAGLMNIDPSQRLTPEQALESPWFQSAAETADATQAKALIHNLREFGASSFFKKAAMLAVAHTLRLDEVENLNRYFTAIDIDGNGVLSLEEMSIVLEAMADLPESESADVARLMDSLDVNGDGDLSYSEFLAAGMHQNIQDSRDLCWRAFKAFDLDDADAITLPHMRKVFDEAPSNLKEGAPTVEEMFRSIDLNSDGKISFQEFQAALKNGI